MERRGSWYRVGEDISAGSQAASACVVQGSLWDLEILELFFDF